MACKDPGITPFPSQQKIQGCTPTSDFVDFWPFETGNWMKLGSLGYMKWCRDTKDVVGLRLLIRVFACQCSPFLPCTVYLLIFVGLSLPLMNCEWKANRSLKPYLIFQCAFLHDSCPWGFRKALQDWGPPHVAQGLRERVYLDVAGAPLELHPFCIWSGSVSYSFAKGCKIEEREYVK